MVPSFSSQPKHLASTASNEIHLSPEQEMLLQDLSIEKCCYPFNETIYNFYRYNFDKKRSKKRVPSLPKQDADCRDDAVYIYKTSNGMVLAALRLTRSKSDSDYTFLRSLCVSRDYRRQRLAMRFLNEAMSEFSLDGTSSDYCYCFASPYLEDMYQRGGFSRIHKSAMEDWPKWLIGSYKAMDEKWSRKTLGLFIKEPPTRQELDTSSPEATCHPTQTRVILLQHGLEFAKPTATGWLLDDNLYFDKYKGEGEGLSTHLRVDRWVWNGRNDTENIEARLKSLGETSRLVLLWTGASDSAEARIDDDGEDSTPKTFIILDGTWQQAKTMYRRIPALWSLSRLCLRDVPPSKYILRGDFSDWKNRFGGDSSNIDGESSSSESSSLLCTAEVVAALFDRQEDPIGGNIVRSRLDNFQTKFLERKLGTKTNVVPK